MPAILPGPVLISALGGVEVVTTGGVVGLKLTVCTQGVPAPPDDVLLLKLTIAVMTKLPAWA